MAVQSRCPFCGTDNAAADGNKRITCKKCHCTFAVQVAPPKGKPKQKSSERRAAGADDGIQDRPTRPAPRRLYEDDDPPARRESRRRRSRQSGPSAAAWIVTGVVVGLFVLVSVAGLALWAVLGKKGESAGTQAAAGVPAQADRAMLAAEAPPGGQQAPVVIPPPPNAPAGGLKPNEAALPAATLQDIKNATVFIKVQNGGAAQSGSGFLMSVNGGTGYVVTNHHVVNVEMQRRPPGFGLGGFPPPFFPEMPFGPFGPMAPDFPDMLGGMQVVEVQVQKATLVFYSGTAQEVTVQGDVIAATKEPDLALLKASNIRNLPKPLDCAQMPALVETMPVYLVGFPFGQALAMNPGNPAITIGKGSISSLRRNARGELTIVQIDGDLNPGNSGGPIVNERGQLVGIAFAVVRDTKIGLAVAPNQLNRILVSRLASANIGRKQDHPEGGIELAGENWTFDVDGAPKTRAPYFSRSQGGDANAGPVGGGKTNVVLKVTVHDPLGRVQAVSGHYLRMQQGQAFQLSGPDGRWLPVPGAAAVDLQPQGNHFAAEFTLPTEKPEPTYYIQFSYRTKDGQNLYTQPRPFDFHREPLKQAPVAGVPQAPPEAKKPLSKDQLAKALEEIQSSDRWAVLRGLQTLHKAEPTKEKRAEVEKAVQPLLNDRDTFIQGDAIKAVGVWGSKDSVPALIKLLKHNWVFTRQAVYDVLPTFKDERSVEPIAQGLKDFAERRHAAAALVALGPMAEKAVLPYLSTGDEFLKRDVCDILAEIGTKASVPALEESAKGKQPLAVQAAKKALARIAERTKAAGDKKKKQER